MFKRISLKSSIYCCLFHITFKQVPLNKRMNTLFDSIYLSVWAVVGDAGSFLVRLSKGLKGHRCPEDWPQSLKAGDVTKENTNRYTCSRRYMTFSSCVSLHSFYDGICLFPPWIGEYYFCLKLKMAFNYLHNKKDSAAFHQSRPVLLVEVCEETCRSMCSIVQVYELFISGPYLLSRYTRGFAWPWLTIQIMSNCHKCLVLFQS